MNICEVKEKYGLSMSVKNNATVRSVADTQQTRTLLEIYGKEAKEQKEKDVKCQLQRNVRNIPANKIVIDNMDKCITRRKFQEYYEVHKQISTLQKFTHFLKPILILPVEGRL
jgi:hypothetical protein